MDLWFRLLHQLGRRSDPGPHTYALDAELCPVLEDLARSEQRPASEIVSELVASALDQRVSQEALSRCWQSLSPREQDVSALTCLGYTNRQIAARLGISDETVKTHLHNALVKFNLHGKAELRMELADWDFSVWEP